MNTTRTRRHAATEILSANWRAPRSTLPTHARMAGSRCEGASPMAVTQVLPILG